MNRGWALKKGRDSSARFRNKSRGRGQTMDDRTKAAMRGSRTWLQMSPTYGAETKQSRTAEKRGWQKYTKSWLGS